MPKTKKQDPAKKAQEYLLELMEKEISRAKCDLSSNKRKLNNLAFDQQVLKKKIRELILLKREMRGEV